MIPGCFSIMRVFTSGQALSYQLDTQCSEDAAYVFLSAVDYRVPIVDEWEDRRVARQLMY